MGPRGNRGESGCGSGSGGGFRGPGDSVQWMHVSGWRLHPRAGQRSHCVLRGLRQRPLLTRFSESRRRPHVTGKRRRWPFTDLKFSPRLCSGTLPPMRTQATVVSGPEPTPLPYCKVLRVEFADCVQTGRVQLWGPPHTPHSPSLHASVPMTWGRRVFTTHRSGK